MTAVMKRFISLLSISLCGLGLSLGVNAAGDVTAEVLVDYCGVTDEDPESHTAIAFCYGYIDAALDYHHAILPDGERITCPPDTVTRKDVAVAVVEWATINTDKVDDQSPIHVVMEAAGDTWPCEQE